MRCHFLGRIPRAKLLLMASAELHRHVFGPTGIHVPKVGLGTWYLEQSDSKTATLAVQAALDLGLTHIDTAELYGSGKAESLSGRPSRDAAKMSFWFPRSFPATPVAGAPSSIASRR